MLEAEPGSQQDGYDQYHSEPRESRAQHEIRRENRRVPARNLSGRKQQRDLAMDGNDQGNGQPGREPISLRPAQPMAGRTPPAERRDAKENLPTSFRGTVACRGKVRNEAGVPEGQRYREIGQ